MKQSRVPLYLLDTNTVAYIMNGRSKAARRRLAAVDGRVAISVITEAEIRYGLCNKPEAVRWKQAVEEFLSAVEILPWDSDAAHVYGTMRSEMRAAGRALSAMDLLIAAHAAAVGATLVTNDKAFRFAPGLRECVNWASDI